LPIRIPLIGTSNFCGSGQPDILQEASPIPVPPPELDFDEVRPRDFGLKNIVGKAEQKAAWSRTIEVVTVSMQSNTDDWCGLAEWGGGVAWITWKF
jgi:hypothetical protein